MSNKVVINNFAHLYIFQYCFSFSTYGYIEKLMRYQHIRVSFFFVSEVRKKTQIEVKLSN